MSTHEETPKHETPTEHVERLTKALQAIAALPAVDLEAKRIAEEALAEPLPPTTKVK